MRVECRYGSVGSIVGYRPVRTAGKCSECADVQTDCGRCASAVSRRTVAACFGIVRHLPPVDARVFAQALTEILRRLDDARTHHLLDRYALIGGFAVAAWGVPRATHDLDFALALGAGDPAALSRHLGATFQAGDADDPLRGVFQMTVTIEDVAIPVQLIVLPSVWNRMIFSGITMLSVFGGAVPVVSWQSLILLKLYAGGPQDFLDARQILAVCQPSQADMQEVSALADRTGLSTAWQALTHS